MPKEVLEAGIITAFKIYLDKYMDNKGLEDMGHMYVNGTSW